MIKIPTRLDLFKILPVNARAVEVGVRRGDFSEEILKAHPTILMYLVDPWKLYEGYPDSTQAEHDDNLKEVHWKFSKYPGRVQIIRGESHEVSRVWQYGPVDAIYLDGNHSYSHILEDLVLWSKHIKTGGCIMGHDYIDSNSPPARQFNIQVIEAVTFFCNNSPWEMTMITDEEFPSFRLDRK